MTARIDEAERLTGRLSVAARAVPGECGRASALETVIWSLLMDGEVTPEAVERRVQQLEVRHGHQGDSDDAPR